MKTTLTAVLVMALILVGLGGFIFLRFKQTESKQVEAPGAEIKLPAPVFESETAVEAALRERRSIRTYAGTPLTLAELAQLLWAAQGVTHPDGYRTAPSAGGLYPLETYAVAGNVKGLAAGIYRYRPHTHTLVKVGEGDKRGALSQAALDQEAVAEGAAVMVLTAVYERTTGKYGERGVQYVHMEVGSAAQNVYLQAVSLDLGTVFIGAFHDDEVQAILDLPDEERPLCLMPIGRQ